MFSEESGKWCLVCCGTNSRLLDVLICKYEFCATWSHTVNFLFGRIFWVIEIVQLCPAADRLPLPVLLSVLLQMAAALRLTRVYRMTAIQLGYLWWFVLIILSPILNSSLRTSILHSWLLQYQTFVSVWMLREWRNRLAPQGFWEGELAKFPMDSAQKSRFTKNNSSSALLFCEVKLCTTCNLKGLLPHSFLEVDSTGPVM